MSNETIYEERGLIFKTGILLHGKAGTGKSTLANAIATYMECSLITIDMSTFSYLNTSEVVDSINQDETRYVILLDEIDTVFVSNRTDDAMNEKQKETISKLLTMLDSPKSPTNVIFVATTNYFENLDPALIRKGRFDLVLELDDISEKTAIEMCKSFNLSYDQIEHAISECNKNTDKKINQSSYITEYYIKNHF